MTKAINENGNSSEEINGQQSEEKPDDVKQREGTCIENNPIAENEDFVTKDSAPLLTSQEAEISSVITPKGDLKESSTILKDDTMISVTSTEEVERIVQQSPEKAISDKSEKHIPADTQSEVNSIKSTVEEIHQNGSNNICDVEDNEVEAQTEVNIHKDNTSAEILEIISSSSNNPSKDPVDSQNLNSSVATLDDIEVESDVQNKNHDSNNVSGKQNIDVIYGENEIVTPLVQMIGNEASPPPLPISPPPSNVSVFAFSYKAESANNTLENPDIRNTTIEDIENKTESPIANNYTQHSSIAEKEHEVPTKTSKEDVCLNDDSVVDENIGNINTENKDDTNIIEVGHPEIEAIIKAEGSRNELEPSTKTISQIQDEDNIKFEKSPNEMGLNYENEIPTTNDQTNSLSQMNLNITDISHVDDANNSSEIVSSMVLTKNDDLDDCLPPNNIQKVHDDINAISDNIDNVIGDETKVNTLRH